MLKAIIGWFNPFGSFFGELFKVLLERQREREREELIKENIENDAIVRGQKAAIEVLRDAADVPERLPVDSTTGAPPARKGRRESTSGGSV